MKEGKGHGLDAVGERELSILPLVSRQEIRDSGQYVWIRSTEEEAKNNVRAALRFRSFWLLTVQPYVQASLTLMLAVAWYGWAHIGRCRDPVPSRPGGVGLPEEIHRSSGRWS